jgi:hypothetical protein
VPSTNKTQASLRGLRLPSNGLKLIFNGMGYLKLYKPLQRKIEAKFSLFCNM